MRLGYLGACKCIWEILFGSLFQPQTMRQCPRGNLFLRPRKDNHEELVSRVGNETGARYTKRMCATVSATRNPGVVRGKYKIVSATRLPGSYMPELRNMPCMSTSLKKSSEETQVAACS